MIFYNYSGYFGKRNGSNKKEEVEEKPQFGGGFDYGKWQWHLMVKKLVDELNMKPTEVYEMNYIDCLNWLSMFHQKDKYIESLKK